MTTSKNLLDSLKKFLKISLKLILPFIALGLLYLITLFCPQPFYKYKVTLGKITIYSDKPLPTHATKELIKRVETKIKKSELYKPETLHRVYLTSNPTRWRYFTNINYKVGGLNYVVFNHSIFLRKVDVQSNRLFGPSGKKVPGYRTLDYFIAHEITHTLEFESMPFYKYPIQTNWTLEGYADYIAHDSEDYSTCLKTYLTYPETTGAKYYTRNRTLVAYLLEEKQLAISKLWSEVDMYDVILKEAIPEDKPKIDDEVYKW
ncbi:MAG: hypothetical protein Fur003_6250 [Candidatus Dojkabacteria bacterium]